MKQWQQLNPHIELQKKKGKSRLLQNDVEYKKVKIGPKSDFTRESTHSFESAFDLT